MSIKRRQISDSEMIAKLYAQDQNQLYPRLISSRLTSLMAEITRSWKC